MIRNFDPVKASSKVLVYFTFDPWFAAPAKVASPATFAGVQALHVESCAHAELWTSNPILLTLPQYFPGYLPCNSTATTVATVGAPKSTWIHSVPPLSMVTLLEAHQVFGQAPKAVVPVAESTQCWNSMEVFAMQRPSRSP